MRNNKLIGISFGIAIGMVTSAITVTAYEIASRVHDLIMYLP